MEMAVKTFFAKIDLTLKKKTFIGSESLVWVKMTPLQRESKLILMRFTHCKNANGLFHYFFLFSFFLIWFL